MKPPTCEVCGDRFEEEGELLEFARTPSDEEWYERAAADDFVGHPPNLAWFCSEHAPRAARLTDQTLAEALKEFPPET